VFPKTPENPLLEKTPPLGKGPPRTLSSPLETRGSTKNIIITKKGPNYKPPRKAPQNPGTALGQQDPVKGFPGKGRPQRKRIPP